MSFVTKFSTTLLCMCSHHGCWFRILSSYSSWLTLKCINPNFGQWHPIPYIHVGWCYAQVDRWVGRASQNDAGEDLLYSGQKQFHMYCICTCTVVVLIYCMYCTNICIYSTVVQHILCVIAFPGWVGVGESGWTQRVMGSSLTIFLR